MSDIGKVRRTGGSSFPSVRKSSDPFVPELGEVEFSEELAEFDESQARSVRETVKTTQGKVEEDQTSEKNLKKGRWRKFFKRKETPAASFDDEDTVIEKDDDDKIIDILANIFIIISIL
jgi:hypothetical protein